MGETLLKFSFTEFERDPSGRDLYAYLTVRAIAGEFRGQCKCVVVARDFEFFLSELDVLAATSQGQAQLKAGWGHSESMQLTFAPHGSRGHIAVRVFLRDLYDPVSDLRFEGSFVTEPQPVARFAANIRDALRAEQRGDVELYVR